MPTNYRALLAMTRLLLVTDDTPLSLVGEEISVSDKGTSSEPAYWYAEFTLRKAKILCPGFSDQKIESDEDVAVTRDRAETGPGPQGECDAQPEISSASRQTGSSLKLRIYLGMS